MSGALTPDVLIPRYAEASGLTVKAIRRKIEEGIWLEGREYHRAADGHIYVDVIAATRFDAARAAYRAEKLARRRRHVRIAPWADRAAIKRLYEESAARTLETGVPHHVDHVIPLRGRRVSGLHVETNLRVLPAAKNIEKGNRFP